METSNPIEGVTLKHLSPYLPYGLNMYYELLNDRNQLSWVLTPAKLEFAIECQNKPILRPLSDLTKEIEVNGERFVPIIEMLKIKYPGWIERHPVGRYSEIDTSQDGWYCKAWFSFQATHEISVPNHSEFMLTQPYWIIQKLYEWHFAIDIPSHLYIDLNTINK